MLVEKSSHGLIESYKLAAELEPECPSPDLHRCRQRLCDKAGGNDNLKPSTLRWLFAEMICQYLRCFPWIDQRQHFDVSQERLDIELGRRCFDRLGAGVRLRDAAVVCGTTVFLNRILDVLQCSQVRCLFIVNCNTVSIEQGRCNG